MPLVNGVYRLPAHAIEYFGRSRTGVLWGGVPWRVSRREEGYDLKGLQPGSLQHFPVTDGNIRSALFFESDCDIDYDGTSARFTSAQLLRHDKYWRPDTSLTWKAAWKNADGDLTKFCDSRAMRGVVVPPQFGNAFGIRVGDLAVCCHGGLVVAGQVYDIGPKAKLGEVSHAMAGALNIPNDPTRGNTVTDLCTIIFPGTGSRHAMTSADQWEGVIECFGRLTGRIK